MIAGLDLEGLMRAALAEAAAAGRAGDRPIGAVVVVDGAIVGRGQSWRSRARNRLAHAETQALQAAGEALWSGFERAVLVTTLEPCPMCLGAAVMARVPHIVFACPAINVESARIVEMIGFVRSSLITYRGGVLEAEARALMARFDPALLAVVDGG